VGYFTTSTCKNVLNTETPQPRFGLALLISYFYYYQYIFIAHGVKTNTQIKFYTKLYLYSLILHSVYWILWCPEWWSNLAETVRTT